MEIRVNMDNLKGLSKGEIWATMRDRILSVTDGNLVIENVPYQGDCEASSVPLQTWRDRGYMKGAGLSITLIDWEERDMFSHAVCEPCRILTDNLKGSLSWLYDATSRDEGRPNLQAIHFENKGGIIDIVACDGHRLGWDQAINEAEDGYFSVNVRRDVIASALKLAGKKGNLGMMSIYREYKPVFEQGIAEKQADGSYKPTNGKPVVEFDGTQRVKLHRHNVRFTGLPGYYWHSATTDLEYPEFRRVVPSGFRMTPKVCYSEFKAFVSQCVKISKATKQPLIRLRFDAGILTASVTDGNKERIEQAFLSDYEGETFEIAYNVRYLLEALDGMTGEPDDKIKFCIKGEASASLLIDRNRKAVIMPVRI